MKDLKISEDTISFENPNQILNMGGPWVGSIKINSVLLMDEVLLDNIVYDELRIYFIKYHHISKWKRNNHFFIHYFDLISRQMFKYNFPFDQIFIREIHDEKVVYCDAFYDNGNFKEINLANIKQEIL